MNLSALAKKLRFQEVKIALILNAPEGFQEALGEVPATIQTVPEPGVRFDYAHTFVRDRAELDRTIDEALESVKYDGIFWISYPKGSSGVKTDINRDSLWEAMKEKGIRPVMQVSVDSTWSALRFRPAEAVGT